MSRATCNSGDENVLGAMTNGNAVVSSSNYGVSNVNIYRTAQVEPVGIWALFRRSNFQVTDIDVAAIRNLNVETHAVHEIQIVHLSVLHCLKDKGLRPHTIEQRSSRASKKYLL